MYIKNSLEYLLELKDDSIDIRGEEKMGSLIGAEIDELDDIQLDVFELIREKVIQVAKGKANSLIITGQSGIGKTYDVTKALTDIGLKPDKDYVFNKGNISAAGLFEELFVNHDKLIVFDDCDSVFADVNTLKSALDSYPEREVTRKLKTHFSTVGMTMNDILANYYGDPSMADDKGKVKKENKGKLPKTFIFTGRVIFISNLKQKEIDSALITRASASIDVDLTHQEVIERLRKVMESMKPEVPLNMRYEVLHLVDFLTMNYKTRHPLSIRTVANAIDTRVYLGDQTVEISDKKYPKWQVVIKQDMIGKKAEKRPIS